MWREVKGRTPLPEWGRCLEGSKVGTGQQQRPDPGPGTRCPPVPSVRYLSPSRLQGPSWVLPAQSLAGAEAAAPARPRLGAEEGAGPGAGAALRLEGPGTAPPGEAGAGRPRWQEEVVRPGSDAARFVGASLVYLFIYCGSLRVRARSRSSRGGGGGRARDLGELEPGSKRRVTRR